MTSRTYRLRTLRLDAKLTQADLAKRAGLPLEAYRALEQDELEQWPGRGIAVLLRMADILGVAPTELYPRLLETEDEQ